MDVGGLVEPERDDPRGMRGCCRDQPVAMRAVKGDDRNAAGFEPGEDLALSIRDRFLAREKFGVRRCDRRDDRDVRADKLRQLREFAAWFIPISNTPKRVAAGIRDRLSGTPVWLL